MRRRWGVILAVLVLLVAVAAGVYLWRTGTPAASSTPARTATVVRQDIENTVNASGAIQAEAQTSLVFVSQGTVASVDVQAGDRVAAGQALATLDTADIDSTLAQAEQAVIIQQLTLSRLQAPPSPQDLAAAEAAVKGAEARLAQARRGTSADQREAARLAVDLAWNAYQQADVQRNAVQDSPFTPTDERAPYDASAGLASINYQIAVRQYKLAQKAPSASAIASAQAQLAQAQAGLNLLLEGAGASSVRSAELQLALTESQRDRTRLLFKDTSLTAPHAGLVAAVNVQAGARSPSDKPAIVLVDDGSLHLDIAVDEVDVARLTVGQTVTVTLDALPELTLRGRIDRIASLATNLAGVVSYSVRVVLVDTDPSVRVGMTASALVVTERRVSVLVVPNWAIRIDRDTGQAYVPVQRATGVVEVAVTLGLRNESVSEVLSGVNEGDVLVLVEGQGLFGSP